MLSNLFLSQTHNPDLESYMLKLLSQTFIDDLLLSFQLFLTVSSLIVFNL